LIATQLIAYSKMQVHHQLHQERLMRAQDSDTLKEQANALQCGKLQLDFEIESRQADKNFFVEQFNNAKQTYREEKNEIYNWALPKISSLDQQIGVLNKTIDNKNEELRKMKKTLKRSRCDDVYDERLSRDVNTFLYYWNDFYKCRHYMNGNCHNHDVNCTRIHTTADRTQMIMDLDEMRLHGYAEFIDGLYKTAVYQNWACRKLIYDIREYMYTIA
jgi:hypothetical protein